ncbi:MAG: endolytic transglycosylase MltG [Actinobacteria bacterium]|uniref:Unannotated protein n=1 Tax=freshwater metagenome TaxID=449393 RepID=A0A6J6HBT3_9ZZZZ|nr:endolytic transglycosylase MltG [Actinomycetota bacterium]
MSRRKIVVIVLAIVLVVTGVTGYTFRGQIRAAIDTISGVDYKGSGTGSVNLVIVSGDTGEKVAQKLVDLGITKDFSYTYKRIIAENPSFIPGTFSLRLQMSANEAIAMILDPVNRLINRVTIKEGLRIGTVFKVLSEETGIPGSNFEDAAKNPEFYGLPKSLTNLDGYLFPATYEVEPGSSAESVIRMMVNRMNVELKKFGVADSDRHKVLTLASIVQKEARITEDFYKVSRVFLNRLNQGMLLQSDATVSYGSGGTTVTTTDAERADPNGYNTYVHEGLPIGPIGAPGSLAIDAALHPAVGDWIYFCAVNLKTGETVFSSNYAGHAKAVKQWKKWMQENPGWNG